MEKIVASILLPLVFGIPLANGQTAVTEIRPGELVHSRSGEAFKCAPTVCLLEFVYVGKEFRVKLPDGKIFGSFKEKEKALSAAKNLSDSKVCDRIDLKLD